MVLAAQTPDIKGKILFYRSNDLQQWQLMGEIAGTHLNGLKEFGLYVGMPGSVFIWMVTMYCFVARKAWPQNNTAI